MATKVTRKALIVFAILCSYIGFSQVYTPFNVRYQDNIKGDLTIIGNSILNRDGGTASTEPNDDYNNLNANGINRNWNRNPETGGYLNVNDFKDMRYIDVDSDASTFSSSSATFGFTEMSCNQIRYAGLYWTGTYPRDYTDPNDPRDTDGPGRAHPINQVQLQIPRSATYANITADAILFDGITAPALASNSPYAAYADVTDLVRGTRDPVTGMYPDPSGVYTVANIPAAQGIGYDLANSTSLMPGGSAGGWTLVVVYENPTLTGKLITTFDGFARVGDGNTVPINYNGFTTIPGGPVQANIGAAALEGDFRLTGDFMEITTPSNPGFTRISNTVNPPDNFFNSNISVNGTLLAGRNPGSLNTLGFDADLLALNNPTNSVIDNNETSATFRFNTDSDQYYPFFNSFNIEIIEPEIVLEKKVEDIGGNDITGLGVNLGQVLDYVLYFTNYGNDDATNYTIRDVLPINVTLDEANLVMPPGTTYTFDPATRTINFSVPDNIIEQGDPTANIRLRVQVAENCFDFIDACTDLIQNLAYSSYQGVINDNMITDDPSVTEFNNCLPPVPGATNFLLDDLSDCNYTRTVELCGDTAILDAGDNFDEYIWVRDDNGNNLFDATDTVITDGDPDNDPSTMTVNQIGTYIVDKIVADPCKGFKEIIRVEPFGSGTIPDPIIAFYNEVNGDTDPTNDLAGEIVTCSIDGDELLKLFLCGLGDTKQLQVNIVDAQSLSWELLDEASCDESADDCANKNLACTWNEVGSGNNFTVGSAGKYRLEVTYLNGCISRFYFNVFQNLLDIQYTKEDIICTSDGNITITNLGSSYGYQLVDSDTEAVIIPFSANNGPSFDFGAGENGGYVVQVTQLDAAGAPIPGACVFRTPEIGILDRDVSYNVNVTNAGCSGLGSVNIQVLNAEPNYEYEIRIDDGSNAGQGTLLDSETVQPDNNFTFEDLNPGNYIAIARTDDGCEYSEQITIVDENDLEVTARVSQHVTCKEGNILLDSEGGKTPHVYAIWTYVDENGVTLTSYPTVGDIPASEYQTSVIFDILNPGDYTFVVVDRNNCSAISNTVTIEFRPPATFNAATITDVACFGDSSGAIQMNLADDGGYQLTYYLYDFNITLEDALAENFLFTDAIAFNSSGFFPGLANGDYTIIVNMRKGSASCNYPFYHTIGSPTNALTADAILVQDYTCIQDGIIQAQNVTGGTAPYEYSINGVNFVSGPGAETFSGLTNGDYTITVRDTAGCSIQTNTITIDPRNEPSDLTFVSTQPLCPALTSDVTVSIVDGTAPFVYEIIAPAGDVLANGNNNVFAGLSPGTYTFQVTDDKGCVIQESYTIDNVVPITVTGQLDNNISCFGLTDGGATFSVGNFANTYDYTISGPATFSGIGETSTTIPLTGLAAGVYQITVTDSDTNCTAITEVTIASPTAALVISNLDVTDISCSATGTNPGSVIITASDGWGGYEYELEDPAGGVVGPQPTNSFTGLTDTSGNYTVTVRDAGGCEVTQTFSLTPAIAPVLEVTANSLCYDSSNGLTLTANVISGGEAPFQYRVNGGAYQTNTTFTGLGPGSYIVEVVDGKNCTASASIDVFPTMTAAANLIKDLDCSASPDAEIRISMTGGNPSFTYEVIRDGASIQASSAVPSTPFSYFTTTAGTYEFVITDSENCTITTNQIVITPNSPPIVVEAPTNPLCDSSSDGAIELQISGGLPPYQIVFDGSAPSTQTTYAGLSAGTYSYTVTDSKGCTVADDVTLTAPNPILPGTIDVVQEYRCDNTSATLRAINYSGGTPGYTFSIDGVNFQTSDTFSTGIVAGNYTITIRDSNGCTVQTPALVIDPLNEPSDLTFTQTNPTCPAITSDVTVSVVDGNAPFVYEIIAPSGSVINNANNNVFTGLAPGTYTFQITDAKGCTVQENYTIADIPQIEANSQLVSNVTCFGDTDGEISFTASAFSSTFSYTVENSSNVLVQSQANINTTTPIAVTGLAADTYVITITDDTTNCIATTSVTVDNPPAALDFTFSDSPVTCVQNSTITVTATDGWGSYEYQLENTVGPAIIYPYQNSNVFTNVSDGTYTIYVRDSGGCIVSKPLTIDPAETPSIALNAASDFCYDGTDQASLVIDITDGVAPYTYSINGGGQTTIPGNTFTISNLVPGTYDIQVTDAYGCLTNVINETIEPQLIASAILTKALDCTVSPDAVIDVSISSGYTPYATYEVSTDGGTTWSPTTAIVGNSFSYPTAVAGTYDFRVTDNRTCSVISQVIVEPIQSPVISSLVQTSDVLCNGDSSATIQVNLDPTQGVAPFTIAVLNTTTGTNYGTQTSGLPAGTYEVTVTDAKSCTDIDTIIIGEPDPITFSISLTDIQCDSAGADPTDNTIPGTISVTSVAGGTVEYSYHLSANNGMPTQVYNTSPGNRDHTFTILNFGIYFVEVIDANGCSVTSNAIIASPPDDLDIDVSTATVDCALGGTAIVTVSSAFTSNDYEFAVLEFFSPPYSNNYQGPDVVNGDTATITGLTPGTTYTFVVFDNATRCYYFETADAPIDTPSNLTWSIDEVSNVTCTGIADGAVDFSIDNYASDATSVSYEIFNFQSNITTGISGSTAVNPPAVGTGVSVTDLGPLAPGVYYILLTENGGTYDGCPLATQEFTIEEAAVQLVANASLIKNDNCNLNAGQVSASAQFGRAPYEYQIALSTDPAPTTATWAGSSINSFNVEGGDYIVYVKDDFNCIQAAPVNVPTDPSPEISLTINNQCIADEGGYSIDITLDVAGVVPHAIRIDGGAPQSATGLVLAGDVLTVSNLSSGAHSVAILDVNGCGETENITIYPPLNAIANISADENCNPANSGEVTVTASGGSGNYSYTQTSPAGPTNTTGVFAGLTHSVSYSFEVEDVTTNCTFPLNISLPAPSIPTFSLSATEVSCFGGNNGTITVSLDPGNIDIPYLYSLDGGATTQASNVFNGLTQGTYNVTVLSDKGCLDTRSVDVNEPSQLDISAAATPFSCDDTASTITVTVNNDGLGNPSGTSPYVYSFDNGSNFQTSNTLQVPFGSPDVNITVRDSNGCEATLVLPIPVRQDVTAVINQNQVIDCVNGEELIEIIAANGSGTYNYLELPNRNVIADPLNIILTQPGTYSYEILDTVTNCSVIVEHVIAPFDLINVAAAVTSDASCSDSADGEIQVTISGYTGTFNYQVLDANGAFVAGASGSDNATADPYVFNVATTLPAGIYIVQITETAFPECVGTSNSVTIDAPDPLAIQLLNNVNANCNEANAIVTVQATGGTAPYAYGASISGSGVPATFPFDETVELDPTVSLNWDIYVRDANNCIIDSPLAVTIETDTTPDISLVIDDECAEEGSFGIIVSLDAADVGVAPYTLSIDGNAFQSVPSFPYSITGLIAGAHSVEIRDANGCGETENITIEPELTLSAFVVSQPTCNANDGVLEFTAGGGSGAFTAELLLPDFSNTGIAPTGNQFTGVPFGDYIIRITDNNLGAPNCFANASIALEEPTPVTLLQTSRTHVSCFGNTDGTITINMEPTSTGVNDNPPYVFEISDGTTTTSQSSNLFTGLPAGTYDITVTSNRNCVATDQVVIVQPSALNASITDVTPFACDPNNSQLSASIQVTIDAGTGTADYFYSINGGAYLPTGGNVFTHTVSSPGNYDIAIRDANGCPFTLPTQAIDPINTFSAAVSQVSPISCAGPEEVLITVTDDGNPHNYSFELLPLGNPNGSQIATTATTATFELTAVGGYTFRVTDTDTGCFVDTTVYDIAPYDLIEARADALTPVICFGDSNGSAELSIFGYNGTFDYEVFTQAGASVLTGSDTASGSPYVQTISGLSGGNYYITITETAAPECSTTTNVFTIISPDLPLTELTEPRANVTCDNDQGELSVVPNGGYAPYDITLTNITTGQVYPTVTDVQAHVFSGLAEGDYRVEVVDANTCTITNDYPNILVRPIPVVADAIPLITNLQCIGDTNGSVTAVNVLNGSGSYEYQLNYYDEAGAVIEFTSGEQVSDTFNGLGAGIYSITVTDGWNCDFETNQVTITEPTQVVAQLTLESALTCANDAELLLTASGGTAPYSYSLDGITYTAMSGGNTHLFNVPAGTYQYYVRDSFDCASTISNAITEDPIVPLELSDPTKVDIACNGESTGSVFAEASFGMGNYQYSLYRDIALTDNVNGVGHAQATGQFNNLPAGTYYISVVSGDCTPVTKPVTIEELPAVDFDATPTMVSCPGEDDGTITITNNGGGTGSYQYAITDPNGVELRRISEAMTEDTYIITDLEGSVAGTVYRVLAQDTNGCFEEFTITIFEPVPLELVTTTTAEFCEGDANGTITLNITNGTPPYQASLNSTNDADYIDVTDGFVFDNLAAGFYEVRVRDSGCEPIAAIAEVSSGPNLTATIEPVYECDSNRVMNYLNITLEDESLSDDVLFAMDSDDINNARLGNNFANLAPGDHSITIFYDMCSVTYPFTIEDFLPVNLALENNNLNEITAIATDGLAPYTFYFNDVNNGEDNTYRINQSGTYVVRVIDQNGCEDIQSIEMEFVDIEIPNFFTPDGDGQNDLWRPQNIEAWPQILIRIYDRYGRVVSEQSVNSPGWDGLYNSKELPTGDYWYVIQLNGENDEREFVGHFTLYR